ncbi:helix-turn-helix domain-containing protein [Aurantimonas sp. HBX-1]|uniref:helix-turn-helix domain-containing protein n=1 Tax=Aurantimonas sp. HBX-1 TaxID=2906072 RepID=UPI001F33B537|nr:helix-turn-helix domain-containing protein [Aurantimonas sp. HBX-1]UIJ70657.1 hypothetical protein LXB15_12955 [Aurantimonas sp. HBX-1]
MQSPGVGGDVALSPPGRPAGPFPRNAAAGRRACRLAREIASAFFAIPVTDIARPSRAVAPVCEARHVAMYLAHVVFQVSLSGIAEAFGRDRTSVAHAVRRIEDRRDDAAFDTMLTRLETLAHAVKTALEPAPDEAADGGGAVR